MPPWDMVQITITLLRYNLRNQAFELAGLTDILKNLDRTDVKDGC